MTVQVREAVFDYPRVVEVVGVEPNSFATIYQVCRLRKLGYGQCED
ncbi:MAG: hypothetical protein AB4290_07180 [Spirulina sp.]